MTGGSRGLNAGSWERVEGRNSRCLVCTGGDPCYSPSLLDPSHQSLWVQPGVEVREARTIGDRLCWIRGEERPTGLTRLLAGGWPAQGAGGGTAGWGAWRAEGPGASPGMCTMRQLQFSTR